MMEDDLEKYREQLTPARDQRVSVRITSAGKAVLQARAQRAGLKESDIVRLAVAYGLQHMPEPTPGVTL